MASVECGGEDQSSDRMTDTLTQLDDSVDALAHHWGPDGLSEVGRGLSMVRKNDVAGRSSVRALRARATVSGRNSLAAGDARHVFIDRGAMASLAALHRVLLDCGFSRGESDRRECADDAPEGVQLHRCGSLVPAVWDWPSDLLILLLVEEGLAAVPLGR